MLFSILIIIYYNIVIKTFEKGEWLCLEKMHLMNIKNLYGKLVLAYKKLMDCSLQITSSSYQRKKLREIKPIQK